MLSVASQAPMLRPQLVLPKEHFAMTIDSDAFSIMLFRLCRSMIVLSAAAALAAVAGCASPGQWTNSNDLAMTGDFGEIPTIDLDKVDINLINKGSTDDSARLGPDGVWSERLGPGDKIEVRIFDTGEQGLFSSAAAKALDLGVFQIDNRGYVNLPYAGRLRASNVTVSSLQNAIVRKLKGSSVSPQATVTITEKARASFTSFGAFKNPGDYKFTPGELTMAQAFARSGGLLDDGANHEKIYLYRQEPAEVANSLGVSGPEEKKPGQSTPVVYQVDMSQTRSFFLMQQVQMKRGDMLYVPNSGGSSSLTKMFQAYKSRPNSQPNSQPTQEFPPPS
jgi:protein involved in polysaccharide export with SLBB domain